MADPQDLMTIQKEIEAFSSRDYKELGTTLPAHRPAVGTFCPFVPEEMIQAAGGHPFRLVDTPVKISQAQAFLPAYCCHPVKSYLQHCLAGDLDFLKGVVFSHSCDAHKGLSEIWFRQGRLGFQYNLMIPTRLDSPLARTFLRAELDRFRTELEKHLGPVTEPRLKEALALFKAIRGQLAELYALRSTYLPELPGDFFARIIRAGFWMDREKYLQILRDLRASLPEAPQPREERIPVYVSGNMAHEPYWHNLIEESGAQIVWDDLCSGARTFRLQAADHDDPLETLAERYFSSFFCPTKYYGPLARQERLGQEVLQSGAKGVIFLLYKYCEPHFFDYPDLKTFFEAQGIPTLLLEVEDPSQSREQNKIRIQAFMEMLDLE
jgi:benzoyl-CoA reductase/2-hydroxyglutaryl-CoA dehydratase subunit BcrC/BadD/HgdB